MISKENLLIRNSRIAEALRGRKAPAELKQKLSRIWKQKYRDGYVHSRGMLGKKMGPETIAKLKKRRSWNKGMIFTPLEEQKRRLKAYSTKYRKAHPEKAYFYVLRRRMKVRQVDDGFNLKDWELMKDKYAHTCPCCKRKEPEIELHIDHIIPLSKGGRHSKNNIQPLCKSCNSSKHTKTIVYPIITLKC